MKKALTLVEASPYKSVAQELEALRTLFRLVCRQYTERVELEIIRVREQVVTAGLRAAEREKASVGKVVAGGEASPRADHHETRRAAPPSRVQADEELSRVRNLRDMLTLLRTMQVKPQEGRRKDLKKIETLLSDLELLTAGWG